MNVTTVCDASLKSLLHDTKFVWNTLLETGKVAFYWQLCTLAIYCLKENKDLNGPANMWIKPKLSVKHHCHEIAQKRVFIN